ncbi:MAG TPA: alpha/beta hydrolase family protein [Opitutaceae bacterium]|nr:alpha/beta hydrolase family protein [Opitutaceae bacterium]
MPWAQVHWRSELLEKQTSMQVILPSVGRPPYATLYLLHGLSDDSTIWMRRSRIEAYVRERPLIVVMPDGYRGFYTDNEEGPPYARHFAREIPDFVERNFPARPGRGARAVGGLSMGGYGALRLALGYPDRFCSVNSHSGALLRFNLDRSPREARRDKVFRKHPPAFFREMQRVFGRRPLGTRHDLLVLVKRARRRGRRLPRILIDCGTEDSFFDDNRRFHRELVALEVPHTYREFPGGHDWDYWDLHVRDALEFHAHNLHLPPLPGTA